MSLGVKPAQHFRRANVEVTFNHNAASKPGPVVGIGRKTYFCCQAENLVSDLRLKGRKLDYKAHLQVHL